MYVYWGTLTSVLKVASLSAKYALLNILSGVTEDEFSSNSQSQKNKPGDNTINCNNSCESWYGTSFLGLNRFIKLNALVRRGHKLDIGLKSSLDDLIPILAK